MTTTELREIRVRWHFGLHENDQGEPTDGGLWTTASAKVRRDFEIIVEAGNEVVGKGSHWLEERDA